MFSAPLTTRSMLMPLWLGLACIVCPSTSGAASFEIEYYADSVAHVVLDPPSPVVVINGIPIFPGIPVRLDNGVTVIPFDKGNNGDIDELFIQLTNTDLIEGSALTFELVVPEAYSQTTPSGTTTTSTTSIEGYDTFHQPDLGPASDTDNNGGGNGGGGNTNTAGGGGSGGVGGA